jgi:hypothetical protein
MSIIIAFALLFLLFQIDQRIKHAKTKQSAIALKNARKLINYCRRC